MPGADLKTASADLKLAISRLLERAVLYFNALLPMQQYAWMAIGAGIVLLVLALILW